MPNPKLAFAVTTSLVAAFAGRALAAPAAWCGHGVDAQFDVTEPNGQFKFNSDADDLRDESGLAEIVGASCSTMMQPEQQRYHAQLEAARARWSKRLHMTDADWADAGDWIALPQALRYSESVDMNVDDRATFAELGPLAQFKVLDPPMISSATDPRYKRDYAADALGSRLTQAGRVAYVEKCLHGDHIDAPRWAVCWPDAEAIDLDKLAVELRGSKESTGADRMRVRIQASALVDTKLPGGRKQRAEAEKRDESVAKLFALAADARKAWRDQAPSLQAALALQDQLDAALIKNSRNPHIDGCAKTARDAFDAVVKATPLAKLGDLSLKKKDGDLMPSYEHALATVVATPAGYLAATAILACAALTDQPVALSNALHFGGIVYRGERTAAMTALVLSGIQPDERGTTYDFAAADAPAWIAPQNQSAYGNGKLVKVTKVGDHVHLEFNAKMGKVTFCDNYRATNHILGIDSNGRFDYEQVCTAYKTEVVNSASKPIDIELADGGALKPGMYIAYTNGVLIAWNNAGDKAPVIVFGVPIK